MVLDEESKQRLKERFNNEMKRKIELITFIDEDPEKCPLCKVTKEFLMELCELSKDIEVKIHRLDSEEAKRFNVSRVPTILIDPKSGYKIRYTGSPLGYEASAFIETVINVSQDDSKLSDESRKKLKELKVNKHIQVFVTPTCPHCPYAVLLANRIAIETKGKVASECVEAVENQDLAQEFNIKAVPFHVIDGKPSSVGVQPESKLVDDLIA
ncbi:MAG TPA: hypothetical protein ENG45_01460 [Candidatus Aenigmarchaeota archaeon]|nr:hypothetical protein [Candidatus Aenigmarchaeota archaeon]